MLLDGQTLEFYKWQVGGRAGRGETSTEDSVNKLQNMGGWPKAKHVGGMRERGMKGWCG